MAHFNLEQLSQSEESIHAVRSDQLVEQVVIVNGQAGCGKTMLSPIIAALGRVELLTYAYEIQYICAMHYLGKITSDAAVTMIQMQMDLQLYNMMMSREINFRFYDLSSVFRDAHPWRYFRRLFFKGEENIPKKVSEEKPILHLTTHNLLPFSQPVFDALGEKLVFIEMVRHPLYMIKQQALNMHKLIGNKRHFTTYYDRVGKKYPYIIYGWEDLFDQSNPVEKAIYINEKMTNQVKAFEQKISETSRGTLIIIPFECFVLNPWPYLEKVTKALKTKVTSSTRRMLKKQNVPRDMYARGIPLKVYKRYDWEPPKSTDENKEFRLRRQFAAQKASPEAMRVLDRLCEEYEEKYLGGKKNYK